MWTVVTILDNTDIYIIDGVLFGRAFMLLPWISFSFKHFLTLYYILIDLFVFH